MENSPEAQGKRLCIRLGSNLLEELEFVATMSGFELSEYLERAASMFIEYKTRLNSGEIEDYRNPDGSEVERYKVISDLRKLRNNRFSRGAGNDGEKTQFYLEITPGLEMMALEAKVLDLSMADFLKNSISLANVFSSVEGLGYGVFMVNRETGEATRICIAEQSGEEQVP